MVDFLDWQFIWKMGDQNSMMAAKREFCQVAETDVPC